MSRRYEPWNKSECLFSKYRRGKLQFSIIKMKKETKNEIDINQSPELETKWRRRCSESFKNPLSKKILSTWECLIFCSSKVSLVQVAESTKNKKERKMASFITSHPSLFGSLSMEWLSLHYSSLSLSPLCAAESSLDCCSQYPYPELSMGFPAGTGSGSLISTTTQSDIKNVFATDAACSKQHLTTWKIINSRHLQLFLFRIRHSRLLALK